MLLFFDFKVLYFYSMNHDKLIHIAYAEDHPVTLEGTIQMLLPMGGIAIDFTARNGKELLEQLDTAKRLPDICMLDVRMPVMDGFETLTEIKKRWPEMKSLAISAFTSEDYILRMVQCGANGYLPKHCEIEDIHNALTTIYREGYYYSELADSRLFHLAQANAIKIPMLTEPETEVLRLCCYDITYQEMAEILECTTTSVEGTRNRLFAKLDVHSRVGLALYAVQQGLIQLPLKELPAKRASMD